MNSARILQKIQDAERRGAPIFSFDYNGKPRNVQTGLKRIRNVEGIEWARPASKTTIRHKDHGRYYVVAVDQNDGRQTKCFAIDKISNVQGI